MMTHRPPTTLTTASARALVRLCHPAPWFAAFGLWLAAMFTASSFAIPDAAPRVEIPHLDKVVHFIWFSAGGVILFSALRFLKPAVESRWYLVALPIVLLSVLGVLDEFRQSFTPGRTGNDPGDWLADTMGGAFGVVAAGALYRRWLRVPKADGNDLRTAVTDD